MSSLYLSLLNLMNKVKMMQNRENVYKELLEIVAQGLVDEKSEAISLLQEIAVACALLSKLLQGGYKERGALFSAFGEGQTKVSPYPPFTTAHKSEVLFSDDIQED